MQLAELGSLQPNQTCKGEFREETRAVNEWSCQNGDRNPLYPGDVGFESQDLGYVRHAILGQRTGCKAVMGQSAGEFGISTIEMGGESNVAPLW